MVSHYAPVVAAAASQVPVLSLGASRVPSFFFGPLSKCSVPGSSIADVSVLGQFSFPGGAAVGSLVSTNLSAGPPLSVRKSTGAISSEKILRSC